MIKKIDALKKILEKIYNDSEMIGFDDRAVFTLAKEGLAIIEEIQHPKTKNGFFDKMIVCSEDPE